MGTFHQKMMIGCMLKCHVRLGASHLSARTLISSARKPHFALEIGHVRLGASHLSARSCTMATFYAFGDYWNEGEEKFCWGKGWKANPHHVIQYIWSLNMTVTVYVSVTL